MNTTLRALACVAAMMILAATQDPHAAHRPSTSEPPAVHDHAAMSEPAQLVLDAPTSSSDVANLAPAATLRADEFDAAIPASVAEANKAAGRDSVAVYVCPMHPEVTSTAPGTCPKCGMTLVKKDER